MKKNRIVSLALAALAALALPLASQAVGNKGDIYSITPYNSDDAGRTFAAGETFMFRVRLLANDWRTTRSKWDIVHTALTPEKLDDYMFPPALGVVISGKMRPAKIESVTAATMTDKTSGAPFTDIICSYTVQSGDLSLPAQLALACSTEEKPIVYGDPSATTDAFYLYNSDRWEFQNVNTHEICQLFYCDSDERNAAYGGLGNPAITKPELGKTAPDYDLSKANFLVKGVDFDRDVTHEEKSQDGASHWRVVRQGKTSIKTGAVVTSGEPTESTTLYVWSEDEDIVRMAGDAVEVNFPTNRAGFPTVKRYVTTIKTVPGQTEYTLTFMGRKMGSSARIALSPILGYRYNQGGQRIDTAYIVEKVYCDEPEKPNAKISFSETAETKYMTVDTSMEPVDTLGKSAIPVYITLSEASTAPVTNRLVITNMSNPACDPITNQNLAVSQNDFFSEQDIAYTNFVMEAGQTSAKVYLYPLGGDAYTVDKGINIDLVLDEQAQKTYSEKILPINLKIRSSNHKPTIVSPESGTDYGAQEGSGFKVPIQVKDCYRDLQNRLFAVNIDFSDGNSMTTNVTFKEGIETSVTLKGYGINVTYANIKVTDPVGNVSSPIKILFSQKPQKTVKATLYDSTSAESRHEGEEFEEGATAYVRFTLSEKMAYGADRYAFLVPMNVASSNLVECKAFETGVKIPGGETNSTIVACAISLLDGCADTDGTSGLLRYSIVLRKGETLTSEEETSFIDTDGLQFKVTNVKPVTEGLYVGDSVTPAPSGELWPTPVASGVPVKFTVMASDVSAIDQTNLVSVWSVTEGRKPRQSNVFYAVPVTNTIETAVLEHTFTIPLVEQTVRVMTIDKDLLKEVIPEATPQTLTNKQVEQAWTSLAKRVTPYEITVTVEDAPHVNVELVGFDSENGIDERGNGRTARVRVSLSEMVEKDLKLKLTLVPLAADEPGELTLKQAVGDTVGARTLEFTIPKNSFEPSSKLGLYNKGAGFDFAYDAINGTSGSQNDGWDIQAEVITAGYSDYFEKSEGNYIIVRNLAPTVSPAQPAIVTTNTTAELGKPFKLTWTPADVSADMKATWLNGRTGLKCEWYVNDALQNEKTVYVTNRADKAVADAQETEITLTSEGVSIVKLVITDYDGADYSGVTERTWLFYIAPTKKLSVTPVGPAGNSKTRYLAAGGLGLGRVWTDGGSKQLAAFNQTWTYNVKSSEANIFAFGYPSASAAYPDNGKLGPGDRDVPITPEGELADVGLSADKYYSVSGLYDNYFYRWAYIVADENGGAPTITYGIVQPTSKADATTQEAIALDAYEENKVSYTTRRLEAVFSREYLRSDNLGDINADGVPDLYVRHYLDFGICDEFGATIEGANDLANLSMRNGDGDFLPNTDTASFAGFIPGLSNTWVTAGAPFTASLEIRGFDNHLNDAPAQANVAGTPDRYYADPQADVNSTLSLLEYIAYTNWCMRSGITDPETISNKATWVRWSPERPTDPTLSDTDDDGLPDGYEYWFWYKAHVGELLVTYDEEGNVQTNYVRMTGHRYNPSDPCHPIVITADEIETLYDPLSQQAWNDTVDTDNDGLPDKIEFMLGTNPVEYDTDGDGLPDGYEVAISKTDPLKTRTYDVTDANYNPDGDHMALSTTTMIPVDVVITNASEAIEESLQKTNRLWIAQKDLAKFEKLAPTEVGPTYSNLTEEVTFYGNWLYRTNPETYAMGRRVVEGKDSLKLLICGIGDEEDVYLLHYQVYGLGEFDPRTGWDPSPTAVNTAPYTTYDEFMSLAFFCKVGGMATPEATRARPWTTIWAENSTNPLNCDSDGDNIPDGWEFYVMGGPEVIDGQGPTHQLSPLWDYRVVNTLPDLRDADADNLDHCAEWCGVTCCATYPTLTNVQPEWRNKAWPTDPWDNDTDFDGLPDGAEKTWIFGTSGMDGGGLNPLSVDTDGDGLPDPWELEFCGTFTTGGSETTVETTTGTNGTTTVTNTVTTAAGFNNDGMNPTRSDAMLDYDNDGLLNWQEYMVGAMRCWRYDDVTSPWGNHAVTVSQVDANLMNDDWWGHVLVETWADNLVQEGYNTIPFNPGLKNGMFDTGVYFSCCKKVFDPCYGRFYMYRDGVDHDLRLDLRELEPSIFFNRWTARYFIAMPLASFEYMNGSMTAFPTKYISCDPRLSDTDNDGMDDFYELYHGLNPLLGMVGGTDKSGPLDIVHIAWGGKKKLTAMSNWWIDAGAVVHSTITGDPTNVRLKDKDKSLYDFEQFPWLAGLAEADPDGDNIRNQQESILPKVQAAATFQHTDPTPLWMTDTSYDYSLTHRYYQIDVPTWADDARNGLYIHPTGTFTYKRFNSDEAITYNFNDFPWMHWDPTTQFLTIDYDNNPWNVRDSMFSYEENEGYDTDGDWLSDYEESQGKTKSASDPQTFDDPIRHQVMWFNGENALLQTPLMSEYVPPVTAASSEVRQDFLFYTVEAWVKPDAAIVAAQGLYTAVERAIWTGPSNAADEKFLRKNFLIGVKNGRWYTMFDSTGTDKNAPIEITDGWTATTNWTHIAATFGPKNDNETDDTAQMVLRLYVNGELCKEVPSNVQPEHGAKALMTSKAGEFTGSTSWGVSYTGKPLISILVGASAASLNGIIFDAAWEGRDQKNPNYVPPYYLAPQTTFSDYNSYFKGYIDEVRIWDGARVATDIAADVKNRVRYTAETASKNRDDVYASWSQGALRSPSGNASFKLPPELMYHWSFDHVPGAVEAQDVLKTPAGFSTSTWVTDAKAIWSRPEGWTDAWWSNTDIRSTVFHDTSYIPWIKNTVAHLPCFDGTTADSVYWTEKYAGGVAATTYGYGAFYFPRKAEVWSRQIQQQYAQTSPRTQTTSWEVASAGGDSEKTAFRFTQRNRLTLGADLLPLGGAYPKRISTAEGGMWDDGKAADAWAQTGTDVYNNGLPDWWETYARRNYAKGLKPTEKIDWDTTVTYYGVKMPAHQAYLRDLAKGMLSDGKYHEEYADERDADGDGLPDWWEDMYGIDTGSKADALADPDHDGLSNYQEYLISQRYNLYPIIPTQPRSTDNQSETDYFLKLDATQAAKVPGAKAGMYLGEVFTDHDFLEDNDENSIGTDPTIYDAYSDKDGDGWTAFSEHRYSTFKMGISARFVSHLSGEEEVRDTPTPVVHAVVRYLGEATGTEPICIEAFAGNNMLKQPTATYAFTPGTAQTRTLNLGMIGDRIVHGTLAPGHLVAGPDQVKLQYFFIQSADRFSWSIGGQNFTGTYNEMYKAFQSDPDNFVLSSQPVGWNNIVGGPMATGGGLTQALQLTLDSETQKGYFLMGGKRVGAVDFVTGDFDIDLREYATEYVSSGDAGTAVQLSQCFFRIEYQSKLPTLQTKGFALSLATADTGALTEGKTAFVAYMDKDADGFTPGVDPIGFVKDVEIGWDNVPTVEIEMTDESQAAGMRFGVANASNETVRVVRLGINGSTEGVSPRIVYSRDFTAVSRNYVFEGDLVSDGKFGLDWDNLRNDLLAMDGLKLKDVTSVDYAVVLGEGSLNSISETNVLSSFSIAYTAQPIAPVAVSPSVKSYGIVETQRPTFIWTGADGYTAFRIQIKEASGKQKTVWQSDVAKLPARDEAGRYVWTAPVYIGTNTTAKDSWVLANNADYVWRVAMYNQKFSDTEEGASAWSELATIKTALAETNDRTTTYGSANVTVAYYGPDTNALEKVLVCLYKTADFTGTPAAQSRLFEIDGKVDSLTNAQTVAFHGLADGTYYAVAFVDRNGNGKRETYETWGYSAQVGIGSAAIWTPVGVVVDHENAKVPTVSLIMEDTDVNQNDILDIYDEEKNLTASVSSSSVSTITDSDDDGLSDFDEGDKSYTKPSKPDTDSDGMPDGWEYVFAGTDPLSADADTVVDGDVMAYKEVKYTLVTTRSTLTATEATYLIPENGAVPKVGDNVNGKKYHVTYDYNGKTGIGRLVEIQATEMYNLATVSNTLTSATNSFLFDAELPIGVGTNVNEETAWTVKGEQEPYELGSKTNLNVSALSETNLVIATKGVKVSLGENRVVAVEEGVTVALVHAQVYDACGFNPLTAVPGDGSVDTKPFTAIDKYLVVRYLEALGLADEKAMNKAGIKYTQATVGESPWAKYTLKPGDSDYDKDGVADGWELYVMFGPTGLRTAITTIDDVKISPWKYGDARELSPDAEYLADKTLGLKLIDEYNDGAAPTDPWNIDTDNDGILDNYARAYNLTGDNAGKDDDGDGLSNYAEYLITEVFKYAKCDPKQYATGDGVCDYYKKVGELYLGEIFTDHDHMDDEIENEIGFNRYVYDANQDLDGNGWSNYAEYRARLGDTWVESSATSNRVVKTFDIGSDELAKFEQSTNRMNIIQTRYWDASKDNNGWVDTKIDGWAYTKVQYTILQETKVNIVVPNVTVKVRYNGTQSIASYVIQAWKDADMMTTPDAVWSVLPSEATATDGNTKTFVLSTPMSGNGVKEGLNAFVVYATTGSDASSGTTSTSSTTTIGEFVAGAPYGFVRDVNVGWDAAEFELEITDVSPVFARQSLTEEKNDRSVHFGEDSGNSVIETDDDEKDLDDLISDATETENGTRIHVRIVPYSYTCWAFEHNKEARQFEPLINKSVELAGRVVAEFDIDTNTHPFITEADFVKNGSFDIDWSGFDTAAFALHPAMTSANIKDITAVRYRIVLGSEGRVTPVSLSDTTTVVRAFSTLIERRFESSDNRTDPSALELKGGNVLYGGRPTFMWRLDEPNAMKDHTKDPSLFGCSYTAFQIQVAETNDTIVYDSGLQRAPTKDALGRFVWTAPLVTGQQTDLAKLFMKAGNWKWRVAMYNAKFKPVAFEKANHWSDYSAFSTAVGQQQETDDHGYGSVKVAVKYAGPATVLQFVSDHTQTNGKVRIQAFKTPDFSGVPEAETIVTDKVTLTNTVDITPNVTLAGLKNGATYYVRAYIDSDGDFKKSDWESWGEAKAGVAIEAYKAAETVAVWIEDADTDGDWLPDAMEYVSDEYEVGRSDITVDPEGQIVYSVTYNDITDGKANISKTLSGASLTFFENLAAAAELLDFDLGVKTDTIAAIRAAVEKKINPQTLKIMSLVVDAAKKQVVLTVGADVADSIAGHLLSPVYTIPTTTKITISIYKKASLVAKEWTWVKDVTKEISGNLDEVIRIDTDEDFSSGFYKVEVVQ